MQYDSLAAPSQPGAKPAPNPTDVFERLVLKLCEDGKASMLANKEYTELMSKQQVLFCPELLCAMARRAIQNSSATLHAVLTKCASAAHQDKIHAACCSPENNAIIDLGELPADVQQANQRLASVDNKIVHLNQQVDLVAYEY